MILLPELIKQIQKYNRNTNTDLIERAYNYAINKHGTQKRLSGDSYISHPLEVANIIANLRLDDASLVVALLHDTIEDTTATREEIDEIFGKEIGKLVEGLTKFDRIDLANHQAGNIRKLLLAVADDVRVLLVKLADRLHNMRTLDCMREEKRKRIAEETIDIYAPLAGRMGMHEIRDELEDLSFRNLDSDKYETISNRLESNRIKNDTLISDIEIDLKKIISAKKISATVYGREKSPYSIYRKMEQKSLELGQLSDIYGFRIICNKLEDCYRVLGIVHQKWPMVPGRFKDYISTPKQNDYKSVHTTVIGPSSQRVELQIRTKEMDLVAARGIAAHDLYKDEKLDGQNLTRIQKESGAYDWLRNSIKLLSAGDTLDEFLEHTKLELFQDQVFCFTPKGRLITLPRKATPIDFAYAVHTDIGNMCSGCKINGTIMPLSTELKSGDEVEIIKSNTQVTLRAWESIAVTGKARVEIRRATRNANRKQYSILGEQILERACEQYRYTLTDQDLKKAQENLNQNSLIDLLVGIGRIEIETDTVLNAIFPDFEERQQARQKSEAKIGWLRSMRRDGVKFLLRRKDKEKKSYRIRGIHSDLPVEFCAGGAVPGDRIVGILTQGKGITIYPIESPQLANFDKDRDEFSWLDFNWDIDESEPELERELYPARISITTRNMPGSLAKISSVIGDNNCNIDNIHMKERKSDFTQMIIDLEVRDKKHLTSIIKLLRTEKIVAKVSRIIE